MVRVQRFRIFVSVLLRDPKAQFASHTASETLQQNETLSLNQKQAKTQDTVSLKLQILNFKWKGLEQSSAEEAGPKLGFKVFLIHIIVFGI